MNQEVASTETKSASTLILVLPLSWTMGNKFLLDQSHPVSTILYRGWRQWHWIQHYPWYLDYPVVSVTVSSPKECSVASGGQVLRRPLWYCPLVLTLLYCPSSRVGAFPAFYLNQCDKYNFLEVIQAQSCKKPFLFLLFIWQIVTLGSLDSRNC